MKKKVYVFGGGTFSHVRTHLSLAAPAFGTTAKIISKFAAERFGTMDVELILTKMASSDSSIVTNEDVAAKINELVLDNTTKVIFFNVAMCDFAGKIGQIQSGKYSKRLSTAEGPQSMIITPSDKVISRIRKIRKDIFLVGFKTTAGASIQEQYTQGLGLLKKTSCNLVLANDVVSRQNMIITPEESKYSVTTDRDQALAEIVDMAYHRSHLTFTRSSVVDGNPIPWNSDQIYPALRTIVNYCISYGAYKPFNGATVGHFACKLNENTFLTSIRKSNFNDIEKNGLVKVVTDGDDNVIAYGAKPSVGGQSQRLIFSQHSGLDCIVHFHCPLKSDHVDDIPVVSQREYECGSHQCGQNTSNGLAMFRNGIACVMLDKHGPNIVFNHSIDPQEVIDFISDNFDLSQKTDGFERVVFEKLAEHE